jgi:hypothetical protein
MQPLKYFKKFINKNVDFLDFVLKKNFEMIFNMVAQKTNWKKLNFWNENYMVNFKLVSNTLEMDFQKGL